jgi:hypothetical protein
MSTEWEVPEITEFLYGNSLGNLRSNKNKKLREMMTTLDG